jgi:hypothetical protein
MRITYSNINVDLDRGWNSFDVVPMQKQFQSQADSGIRKTYNFFNQKFITATMNHLKPEEREELRSFMEYARDGSTFSIEKDRNLGAVMTFEGKQAAGANVGTGLQTNDGTAATFTRDTDANEASYVDPSTGLVTFMTATTDDDTARFPAGKYGRGVLVEGARTNIIQQSEDFSTTWATGGTATVATNTTDTTDPVGTNTADEILGGASGGQVTYDTGVVISTDEGCFSVWLKCASGTVTTTLTITNDVSIDTLATDDVTVTPTWQRFSVAYNNAGTDAEDWQCLIGLSANDEVYAWGAQMEVGVGVLYPTQVMRTAGSTTTRPVETLLCSTTDILNTDKGTISMWFKPPYAYDALKLGALMLFQAHCSGDAQPFAQIFFETSAKQITFRRYTLNSANSFYVANVNTATITKDAWNHVVATWDTTIASGLGLYINGADAVTNRTDTAAFSGSEPGTSLAIGSNTGGANQADCVIDDVRIYKDAKDSTFVSALYNGLRRYAGPNRFSSVRLTDPNDAAKWLLGDTHDLTIKCEEVKT